MKAVVYTKPGEIEVLDVPEPSPAAGEVLVQVEAVGICGSELEGFATRSPMRVPPLIMGHEFAGVRVDTGQQVVVNPVVACGGCDLCLRGQPNVCRSRQIIGVHRSGGYAERVAVPEASCYPLPSGLAAREAALTEPLANAVHAFRLAQVHDAVPQRVGVIGGGALGLATTLVALRRGVPEIVVSELSKDRLEVALAAGAHHVVDRLDGEFDVIFDTVGTAGTRADSLDHVRPGGTAVWIGLHGPEAGFDGLGLIRGEKRVLGTFCYHDVDFRDPIAMAAELSAPDWIATFDLADGADVFQRLLASTPAAIKTMLVPA